MNKDLVSVIIPAYNHELYVQETINSIIAQTYQNIELIIVDDGSKDNTFQKIQEMKEVCEKRFVNVYFETKKNEGTCKTYNKLLELSQGDYIYVIASDDKAKPNAIEKEVSFLTNNPEYALVVGDDEFIDKNGQRCFWDINENIVYDENNAEYKTFGEFLQKSRKDVKFNSYQFGTYQSLYVCNYIPNGYLIRKSIFKKIGLFTPKAPLEDYWLMLQISKYSKMKYIDEVLFSYRQHDTNTSSNKEHMIDMTYKTKAMEEHLLFKFKKQRVSKEIIDIIEGLYKKQGIPYIFQILSYKRDNKKLKRIYIFGIKIYEYTREMK